MPRYKLTLEYDGRRFVGWQAQDNGPSVQAALEGAIAAFAGHRVTVQGSGRTDAGVHARGQVAHVDLEKPFTPHQLVLAANHHLGAAAVSVLAAEPVENAFHARFDARRRHYCYRILNRRGRPCLEAGLVWHIGKPLDVEAMRAGAAHLLGRHDFTTFRHVHCQARSPVKTLDVLTVEPVGEEVRVHAAARSFLHHQVRSMVGCLVWVGLGKWPPDEIGRALATRDRRRLAMNAPPDGLYFMRVVYPQA
ncbi:MAG: tRNA pseudouridine(38-40) synthase TruA [Rhodothalassiaceae bacterium]